MLNFPSGLLMVLQWDASMPKSRTLYTVGTVIGIMFISLTAHDFFSEGQPVQEEIDVTEKIVKLELGVNIHINQIFKADIICLLPADLSATAYLGEFPGKTSLRDDDYDVSDSEGRWHIIAIEDLKPISRIFDVDRDLVDLDIDPDLTIDRVENFCSRDRVIVVKYNGHRRIVSIVDAGHL